MAGYSSANPTISMSASLAPGLRPAVASCPNLSFPVHMTEGLLG